MDQVHSLLNDCLIKTKHVEHAAIIKLKAETVWASTIGFNLQPQGAQILSYAFCKNLLQVRREGLYFREKHYKCVRADESSLYLKNEDGGLIAVKTNSYILVATYTEGMYPSVCVEAIEKLEIRKTESAKNLKLINLIKTDLLENQGRTFVMKHIQTSKTISIILQCSKRLVKALKEKDIHSMCIPPVQPNSPPTPPTSCTKITDHKSMHMWWHLGSGSDGSKCLILQDAEHLLQGAEYPLCPVTSWKLSPFSTSPIGVAGVQHIIELGLKTITS